MPRSEHNHVVLVPGFFGFGRFGQLSYFSGVREALAQSELGLQVSITEVETLPTASIRHRATRGSMEEMIRLLGVVIGFRAIHNSRHKNFRVCGLASFIAEDETREQARSPQENVGTERTEEDMPNAAKAASAVQSARVPAELHQ